MCHPNLGSKIQFEHFLPARSLTNHQNLQSQFLHLLYNNYNIYYLSNMRDTYVKFQTLKKTFRRRAKNALGKQKKNLEAENNFQVMNKE